MSVQALLWLAWPVWLTLALCGLDGLLHLFWWGGDVDDPQ